MAQSEKKKKTARQKQSETATPTPNSKENPFACGYLRRLKMCYTTRHHRFSNSNEVPSLHLSGNWLQKAGFETGNYTTLFVSKGLIVIRKEENSDVEMWRFEDLKMH